MINKKGKRENKIAKEQGTPQEVVDSFPCIIGFPLSIGTSPARETCETQVPRTDLVASSQYLKVQLF